MALLAKTFRQTLLTPTVVGQTLVTPRFGEAPAFGGGSLTFGAITVSSAGTALVTPVVLTSGVDTAGTPTTQQTASITPTANRVVYAAILHSATDATAAVPTAVTGNGLTWVQEETQALAAPRRLTVFRAMGGSPSAGVVTFDWGAEQQNSRAWIIVECGACDTSGTNGSGATIQSVPSTVASGTTHTSSLAALGSSNNIHLAFCATRASGHTVINPDADFAEIADVNTTADGLVLECQWARNQVDCTYTWGSTDVSGVISLEVKSG